MSKRRYGLRAELAAFVIALESFGLNADNAFPATAEKDAKMTLSIRKGIDFEFVKCPAGTFTMGVIGDLDEKSPKREHKVTLTRPFWMMTKKVTWKQWKANGDKIHWEYPKSVCTDNIPVFRVSHNEAAKYCEKMTKRFKSKLPKGYVLRLPTEAEWEYALDASCEDSDDSYIVFRDTGKEAEKIMVSESDVMKLMPSDDLEGIAQIKKQGLWKYLCPVAMKLPNKWGLYDMLANGGEMTLDQISCGKINEWDEAKLWGKLTYREEETDPFKFDPWGDVYIARGTPRLQETHKGAWFEKDARTLDQSKFSMHGFRLVIGPDYIGEWKAKNAAKAKANKGKSVKRSAK